MVSHWNYNRNTKALNPASIPFHIIFLAKTMKYYPISFSCAEGLGRNPQGACHPGEPDYSTVTLLARLRG